MTAGVDANAQDTTAFNIYASVAGASASFVSTICINNTSGQNVYVFFWLVLNINNWRGDGVNSDLLVDTRPLVFPPGTFAFDINSYFDGLAAGYHRVDTLYATSQNGSGAVHRMWDRIRSEVTKA